MTFHSGKMDLDTNQKKSIFRRVNKSKKTCLPKRDLAYRSSHHPHLLVKLNIMVVRCGPRVGLTNDVGSLKNYLLLHHYTKEKKRKVKRDTDHCFLMKAFIQDLLRGRNVLTNRSFLLLLDEIHRQRCSFASHL